MHQQIITKLIFKIKQYIASNNGPCNVYPAPFDVILKNEDEDINSSKNIVQPDISVICDKNKLTDKGCTGAPNMIIEVVSPFNPSSDYVRKLNLYQQFHVRKYLIINPIKQTVLVYILDKNNLYAAPESYTFKDKIKVSIYDNLEIDFNKLDLV